MFFLVGYVHKENFGLGVRQQKRLGTAVLDHHITVENILFVFLSMAML